MLENSLLFFNSVLKLKVTESYTCSETSATCSQSHCTCQKLFPHNKFSTHENTPCQAQKTSGFLSYMHICMHAHIHTHTQLHSLSKQYFSTDNICHHKLYIAYWQSKFFGTVPSEVQTQANTQKLHQFNRLSLSPCLSSAIPAQGS